MRHGQDDGVELLLRQFVRHVDAVLIHYVLLVGPRIVDRDPVRVFLQRVVDVHNLGVADIRAVFLEGDTQYKDLRVLHNHALLVHALDGLVRHISAHAVIQAARIVHHARKHAIYLRLLDQVVRVHGDAVAAHEAGAELDEIPFGRGRLDYVMGIDAHRVEDLGQLVHEGDVHVSLGILDDLRGLGHADGRSLMGTVHENRVVDRVHIICDFRRGTGGNFLDLLHGVLLVAGVDALRGIAREEIDIELQTGYLLHHREAFFLGDAGIDGALIDDDVAPGNDFAHGLGRAPQRFQVRTVVLVHRRRDGHHVEVAVAHLLQVRRAAETMLVDGFLQEIVGHFESGVVTGHERFHALAVHVKADGGVFRGKQTCQRKAHIA